MTYRGAIVKEMGGGLLLAAIIGHCNIINSRTYRSESPNDQGYRPNTMKQSIELYELTSSSQTI